ncbi:uncharacterized protein KQ657_003704 [Scheffersomyces spartinae]|uniref:Aminotransferase class I/classII large domain-containing protein n=1 Tax=Scheffersomyces spartinae TaxID=45513 RepID=A0A9P8AJS5_9ASCO|nr:uncharacterized protein KQ657_003704 [Scheffersomyces spartinae]KAG7195179.1 hypothetical protein KQ657_003704 [Scheffersomyces spartinae]
MTADFELSHLISKRAASRQTSHFSRGPPPKDTPPGFKAAEKFIPLHWGTPNEGFFPIESIDVNVVDHPFQASLGNSLTNASLEALSISGQDSKNQNYTKVSIKKHSSDPDALDLAHGLQYSEVKGTPELLKFTREFITRTHKPNYEEWDTITSNGAGEGLNKVVEAILDPGDVVLVEEFTFTPFLQNIRNVGGVPVPIKLNLSHDSEGLDIEYLTDLLENWEELKPGLSKPKALYTIPTGQNPTGLTQSIGLRRKVYALAEKYDFFIIEDDPYGYLTLPSFQKPSSTIKLDNYLTVEEYLKDHLTPSYLTIDSKGSVIRVETFSKLFAPGLRLGFIVAHERIIEVMTKYSEIVVRSSSGTSQTILTNVIKHAFGGVDGWLNWILKMRATYSHRKDILLNTIYESKAYKSGYIDVIDPHAGMFASVIINFPSGTDIEAKIKLLIFKFLHYGVGVVPGINMAADKEFSKERGAFFRITYAPAPNDQVLTEGGELMMKAIVDFFEKDFEF